MFHPINYNQPLFRPPSEAHSLIFQVTLGCSWNRCAFCDMYTSKKFSVRPLEEVYAEIDSMAALSPMTDRVFLADGNAMVLKTVRLLSILNKLKQTFPKLRRISAYALPSDLSRKSHDDLKMLKEAGLKMVYIGLETGDDELLKKINKGETYQSSLDGCLRAKEAEIKLSVMILNGLGGVQLSHQHAVHSAELVNQIQPEYLSTLVLSFPLGLDQFKKRFDGEFTPLHTGELLQEMGVLLSTTDLAQTVFRSDHASNYLVLRGQLNRDKEKLIQTIQLALSDPEHAPLRQEWQRGL